MFKYKKTVLSLAILSALSLSGCGGGSGSGGGGDDGGVSGVTTSGVVAKGIINDGIVTALELGSDPSAEGVEVGSAVTEVDGTYALEISDDYTGGPIQLTITTDANSQVKCDTSAGCGTRSDDITDTNNPTTIDFGEWYKPGADTITMRAMIAGAAEGATVSAQITPFTDMAASRALAAPTFDSDAIANANSEVSSLLKVNILSTEPVDITDLPADATATEIAYAALSASIANLATTDEEGGTPDIQGAIDALADAFAEGTILATDEDDTAISLQDLIDGANEALASAGVEDTSGVVAALESDVSSVDESGVVNPEPVDTAVLANVDKAKAFVEEFRTYLNTLDAEVSDPQFGGEFESQLTLVSDTLDAATSDNNPIMIFSETVSLADDYLYYALDDEVQSEDTVVTFTDSDEFPFTSGTFTYTKATNSVEIEDGLIGDYTVNITVTASEEGTGSASTDGSGTFEGSDTFSVAGSVVSELQNLVVTKGSFAEDYQEEVLNDTENNVYSSSYFFNSDVDIEVTYSFKESVDSTEVVFTGEISAEVFGKDFYEETYDDGTGFNSDGSAVTFFKNLTLDGELTSGEDNVSVALVVSQPNAEEFYNAETFTETAENYLQANVGVTLEAGVDTLEPVTLNVSAVRTAIDEAQFEMTLSQDDRTLLVSFGNEINATEASTNYALNLELGDVKDGEITVTNLDGVELTLTPNESEELGVVTIDGEEVATIEETEDGVIKTTYSDGSFELY